MVGRLGPSRRDMATEPPAKAATRASSSTMGRYCSTAVSVATTGEGANGGPVAAGAGTAPAGPRVLGMGDGPRAEPRRCDVLVVGGGPSGAACAYWLASAGHDVVLVERKRYPREK